MCPPGAGRPQHPPSRGRRLRVEFSMTHKWAGRPEAPVQPLIGTACSISVPDPNEDTPPVLPEINQLEGSPCPGGGYETQIRAAWGHRPLKSFARVRGWGPRLQAEERVTQDRLQDPGGLLRGLLAALKSRKPSECQLQTPAGLELDPWAPRQQQKNAAETTEVSII